MIGMFGMSRKAMTIGRTKKLRRHCFTSKEAMLRNSKALRHFGASIWAVNRSP